MKSCLLLLALTLTIISIPLRTDAAKKNTSISLGIRQYVENNKFGDYPHNTDILAYGLAYEYHERLSYWQLAVLYAEDIEPSKGKTKSTDPPVPTVNYIVTPQLNLIVKDGFWRAGGGILSSYVATENDEYWTDPYWQVILGIGFPVMEFSADIYLYYPYENWSTLLDFDFSDVELGLWLGYSL